MLFKTVSVKGGEKVYQRHDEKELNWEPGRARSRSGVRRSGVNQESSRSSETSHALLAHSPEIVPAGMGCRNFDQQQESEANFLAGCVLITNEAARRIVMSGMSLDAAGDHYGVSDQMLQYRLNVSGARVQHQRGRY